MTTTFIKRPDVSVRPASHEDRLLLEGLFQFYMYDWSELEPAASESFEVDQAGRFARYPHLDAYWSKPEYRPGIIEVAGRVGGFVLINGQSHRGGHVEHNMAEFFVMRKHRRGGVASAAFWRTLEVFPGRWEVAVADRNLAAKSFWSKAISAAPAINDVEIIAGDGQHWRGPIFCFTAGGS